MYGALCARHHSKHFNGLIHWIITIAPWNRHCCCPHPRWGDTRGHEQPGQLLREDSHSNRTSACPLRKTQRKSLTPLSPFLIYFLFTISLVPNSHLFFFHIIKDLHIERELAWKGYQYRSLGQIIFFKNGHRIIAALPEPSHTPSSQEVYFFFSW